MLNLMAMERSPDYRAFKPDSLYTCGLKPTLRIEGDNLIQELKRLSGNW